MTCRTGCPTQDHVSYSDCLRNSGVRVAYANSANGWDLTKQKKWDAELNAYRGAKAEGLQPAGTDMRSIDQAKAWSDKTQTAFSGKL